MQLSVILLDYSVRSNLIVNRRQPVQSVSSRYLETARCQEHRWSGDMIRVFRIGAKTMVAGREDEDEDGRW